MQGSERPLKGFSLSCIAFTAAGREVSSVSLRLTAPSAEGAFWGSASADAGDFASAEATKGLCDRPLETFARSPLPTIRYTTLEGRGGSVSRRDHNRAYRRPHPTLRRNQVSKNVPSQTPAALREGARGRGFSQRSRLPRNTPPSLHKLMVNGADGGLEVFVVYADDDGKLAGALINHANVDAGAGH